ncbi:DNA cytosine methyltransferase [Thermodesulfobacteriota bacterium]
MPKKSREEQAIDLFSGVGGLSLGLHEAGWDVIEGFEIDQAAVDNYEINFPASKVFHEDVKEINFSKYKGIGLIAGGPPCQPFSVAGKMLSKNDPRDMVPQFIRAVDEARPLAFLMENVPGLMTKRNFAYSEKIASDLSDLGYTVYVNKLTAYDYGVPQNRHRVFFVGFIEDIPYGFPTPTHGPDRKNAHLTSGEALKDVPEDEPNRAKIVYAQKPILRPSPFAGMLVNGQGRPINLRGPSHTIPATAGGNRTHIYDPQGILVEYHKHLMSGGKPEKGQVEGVRRITVRESVRIQSFPDDFQLISKRSARYRLIGNAVPPLLAKAVGESIYNALFRPSRLKNKVTLKGALTVTKNIFGNGILEHIQFDNRSLPN